MALIPIGRQLHQQQCPDSALRDDLQIATPLPSREITERILRLLDKGKGGMSAPGCSMSVATFIIPSGMIDYGGEAVERSRDRVWLIPIVNRGGTIAWPVRFLKTNAEASKTNCGISQPAPRCIPEGNKRRERNGRSRPIRDAKVLFDAGADGSVFFDRSSIERLIAQASKPKERQADFELRGEFNPLY
jgi:hypothetical protein